MGLVVSLPQQTLGPACTTTWVKVPQRQEMTAPEYRQHIRSAAFLMATLLITAIIVLPATRGLSGSLLGWHLQHEALHAVLETVGCMMALGIAGFLLIHRAERPDYIFWFVCSMLVTGILDAFHASMPLGQGSMFLRTAGQLVGGLCIALVWIPRRLTQKRVFAELPKALAAGASLLAITALAYPQILPAVLTAGRLTPLARTLNSIGGLLFFVGSLHLALYFRRDRDNTRVLFIAYCLLFAVAGLDAGLTRTWAAGWWFLHVARLAAYAVAFRHISSNAAADYSRLVRTEESLRFARDAAENANKAKDRFLANISHDIRTPLNAIIGFSEAMLTSDSIERGRNSARTILRESEHLLSLINEILDHAKLEAGRIDLVQRPVDVRELAEEVLSSASGLANDKELRLELAACCDLPPYVMADAQRLRQVLMNLVGNAVKFTDEGSVAVTIRSSRTDETHIDLKLSVTDTGIGIATDRHACIFDSFTQADDSTTRRFGGTGLGTAIARQLVELMGGRIGLHSEPGRTGPDMRRPVAA